MKLVLVILANIVIACYVKKVLDRIINARRERGSFHDNNHVNDNQEINKIQDIETTSFLTEGSKGKYDPNAL